MTAPAARVFEVAAVVRSLVVDASTGAVGFTKPPAAELDFAFDWTEWLAAASDPADTIASFALEVDVREPEDDDDPDEADLVVDDITRDEGVITFWARGGFTGSELRVRCRITTAGGRIDERSMWMRIAEA